MPWPQYVVMALLGFQLVVHLLADGRREGVDRKVAVVASLMVCGTWGWLLWMGGFWAPLVAG